MAADRTILENTLLARLVELAALGGRLRNVLIEGQFEWEVDCRSGGGKLSETEPLIPVNGAGSNRVIGTSFSRDSKDGHSI
jgi:hypothetical protein